MIPPIRLDRTRLSESAVALAQASGRPVNISPMLLSLWCGGSQPTDELRDWLAEHGCEIVAAGDYGGGWDVRLVGEREFQLR